MSRIEKLRGGLQAHKINEVIDRVNGLMNLSVAAPLSMQRSSAGTVIGLGGTSESQASSPANIRISPEFPGAVLWADPDSANGATGTMNGAFDDTNCRSAYSWTTAEASVQEMCVSVRVPVPEAFVAWGSCTFTAKCSAAAGVGTAVLLTDVYDSTGTALVFVDVSVTADTWTAQAFTMPAGTYTAGGFVTLVFRLRAVSNSIAYLGDVKMDVS